MLHLIKSINDTYWKYLLEDPVRPSVPYIDRIGDNKDIFIMRDDNDNVCAVTCVSYQSTIPAKESELFLKADLVDTAIFYTIWSYKPGAGRQLIFESVKYIKENKPSICRFVTLSPKTEIAKNFHLKNGAIIFRENNESVNYEYK